ncbi:MAG: multidrug ABC transporter ATP-binding protein [Bacteroidetes bacterium HGW-Bacteroidetes-1]|jgi:ABC-type multidrug transport system fused ATPase/permease subunit|nr:MAG: multidrug ABC transporter ATP-binding protein [Bacteroidetes bacterium HGW-Bacteroidetes-1]
MKSKDDVTIAQKKVSWDGLRRLLSLLRYVLPRKYAFFGGLFALSISSLTTLAFPMLLGDLLNQANPEASLQRINTIALVLMGIFAINAVFAYLRIYWFELVTQNMLASLRQTTYNHIIRLPMSFFSQHRVGELNSRISADISVLQETFTFTLAQFIRQIITIIGGVILLSFISVKLTMFMLAFVPIVAVGARFFGKHIRKVSKNTQGQVAQSNIIVEETLQGIANVKAFANESFEDTRYKFSTDQVINIAIKGAKIRAMFISLIVFSLFATIVGVIWYGVYLVNKGEGMAAGDLFKFILYTVFIGASISGLADLYSQVQKAVGATESLMGLLDESPEFKDVTESGCEMEIQGDVEFEGLGFSYPSRPETEVLHDISFRVEKGQKIALVGVSGAGKTTLTALLFRFYDPQKGRILFDGIPSDEIHPVCLRKQMAIVPQEVILFGGSITENIAYGKPDASSDEIKKAAERANAIEFIESFPEDFDTLVGERGVQLSGGQRQRIAIARAILRDPKILILDEATSALDNVSEGLVQTALNSLMKNRTSIIIAHRLSTIRDADKIVVLDQGRVVETGTHEELILKESGIYFKLRQTLEMKENHLG